MYGGAQGCTLGDPTSPGAGRRLFMLDKPFVNLYHLDSPLATIGCDRDETLF